MMKTDYELKWFLLLKHIFSNVKIEYIKPGSTFIVFLSKQLSRTSIQYFHNNKIRRNTRKNSFSHPNST